MQRYTLIIYLLFSIFSLNAQDNYTLTQAIDYALENHSKMKVAKLDHDNSKWQYKEAKSIGMPRFNGDVNYTYFYQLPQSPVQDFISPAVYGVLVGEKVTTENGTITPNNIPDPQTFNIAFQQKQSLNFGLKGEVLVFDGNFLKGLKAARKFMSLSANQVKLTEQDIISNVTRAYQNVLVVQRNIGIINNNIDNITNALRETRIIYENGFAEELDVDRLQLSLENLSIEKEKIQRLVEVSYNVLKYQMAYPVLQELIITGDLEKEVELLLINPNEYIATIAVERRPEHQLLIQAIDLDQADLVRIKQGYIPSVSAKVGYGQTLSRNGLFNGNEAGFLGNGSIGLSARIPIYDGGYTKSKIEQKKIEIAKREIELSEFDRAMTLQVINAQQNLNNAKSSISAAKRALSLNEKIYNKSKIKYQEGVGSSVEVTQAEGSLYQSQAQYINSLFDLITAKTDLDIATGQVLDYNK
ncbi:MAG: outer membrane protein [Saprospiraceae bacterium]|jgi:outer membrane protein